MTHPNISLGISLSGGAARGIAHIGVLQALEEAGIFPTHISGASAGALVGSLYAAGYSPQELMEIVENTSLFNLFQVSAPVLGGGLVDISKIKKILVEYIPDDEFGALKKPFFASVTNMSKGQAEIIHSGPLADVVTASCAIPLLFKPQELYGQVYVDGGLLDNLPIKPLQESCTHVIGVNVTPINWEEGDLSNMYRMTMRTLEMIMWANVESNLKECDVAIEPHSDDFGLFGLDKAQDIYQTGYEAGQDKVAEILTLTT